MIGTLIWLLLFGILVYAAVLIIGMIPLKSPLKEIVYLIVAVIALAVLAEHFGVLPAGALR